MNEIIIVGAGLVGSAIAFRLVQGGARVTLLDAGYPGSGTSGSSFSWLNSNGKTPRAYHNLNVAGMQEHQALRDELGAAPWLHKGGNLEWADDEAGRNRLHEKVERLQEWGYAVEVLSPAQVQAELEPDLSFDRDTSEEVVYYRDDAWLDPLVLTHALQERITRHGGRPRAGCRVIAVEKAGGRVQGVVTETGERFPADMVINCAGPAAGRVASLMGVALPLKNTAGLLALTTPAPTCISRVIHAPGLNLRPDGAGRLLLHHEQIDQTVDQETAPDTNLPGCQELLRRAQQLLPSLLGTRLETARIGIRPIPRDGLSAVGPLPGLDGAYAAVTHSGATLCLVLGRLVAGELLTGQEAVELQPFRPSRFSAAGVRR
ncbi:MAG: NAD(P)/FAD-dependent oxidoreductase [Dehalococcoidia bacterium]